MMELTSFEALEAKVKERAPRRMVVAQAADVEVLEGVILAADQGAVAPILVGRTAEIGAILVACGQDANRFTVVEAEPEQAAQVAVELVASGQADFLMKGMLDTSALLKPVVDKKNGLNMGETMSHFGIYQLPGYHKLIAITDAGMNIHPDLESKCGIVRNAVSVFHKLGYDDPKLAVLCAVEKVNPKMPETLDAQGLVERNQSGALSGCTIYGPLSYDIAMSAEIAQHKGANSPYSGNFDCLVMPNLATGNILGKNWDVTVKAQAASIVVGAKCPIVLPSRGAHAKEKCLSIMLAALCV